MDLRRIILLSTGLLTAMLSAGTALSADAAPSTPSLERRALTDRLDEIERVLRERMLAVWLDPRTFRRDEASELLNRAETLLRLLEGPANALPDAERPAMQRRLSTLQRQLLYNLRRAVDREDRQRLRDALDSSFGKGSGTAQIRGFITGQPAGNPLDDASVVLYTSDGFYFSSTFVNFDGSYLFSGLPAGTYFVLAVGADIGFINELYDNIPCGGLGGSGCDPTTGAPIAVAAGGIVSGINFSLSRGAILAGRLREAGSLAPVPFQTIDVWNSNGNFLASTGSDVAGRYQITGLVAGTYFLRVNPFGGYQGELWDDIPCPANDFCAPTTGTPIVLTSEELRAGLDFDLDALGAIEGRVLDATTGLPVPFLNVFAQSATAGSGSGITNAEGFYRLGGLHAGTYFVGTSSFSGYRDEVYDDLPCVPGSCDPSLGTPVSVSLSATTTGIDFELDRLGEIRGTLRETGGGPLLEQASVVILDADSNAVSVPSVNPEGEYRGEGLQPGSYRVYTLTSAHVDEIYDNIVCDEAGCSTAGSTPVATALNTITTGIDFELDRKPVVAGRVVDSATGEGLGFASVRVWDAAGTPLAAAFTTQTGHFRIEGLPVGPHTVTAETGEHARELYQELPCTGAIPAQCDPTLGSPLNLAINTVSSNVNFTLQRLGEIRGRVTDGVTGDRVQGADVYIWAANGSPEAQVNAAFDGTYRVTGLADGTHFVTAYASDYDGALFAGLPCAGDVFPGCTPTLGTPVTTTSGGVTSGIDLALTYSGVGIVGTVKAQGSGAPLAGVAIDLWFSEGQHAATAVTNAEGKYQFPLFVDVYYVSTDANLGVGDEVWNNVSCPLGPASLGLCNPLLGTPILVSFGNDGPRRADFALSVLPIFADGFESGDTSAWSAAVP